MITIRRNQIGDTPLYRQIRLASLKDAPYAFEATYDSALQRSDEVWHARVESASQGSEEAIFLAFSDHLPIGMAALVRIKGQTDRGELTQVWVSSEHRGTDFAWDLMNSIIFWRTHPAPNQRSATEIMEQGFAVGHVMAVGLEVVIANHLESHTPVVLQGDLIHPSLAAQKSFAGLANDGRVRAIFLYEADERKLLTNFLQREPDSGLQSTRARVS